MPPAPARRDARPLHMLVATLLLAVLVTPFAVAQTGDGDGSLAAGDARRADPLQMEVRNRSRRETGLIANGTGYSLRFSNVREGDGGGLVSGCRSPVSEEACIYGDNLRDGHAFLFRSRGGPSAGMFQVDTAGNPPFETNATGRVANLNADKVDGMDAADLAGQTGPQGPPGPQGPQGEPATRLFAHVEEDGTLDFGSPGVTGSSKLGTGLYRVTFDRLIQDCAAVANSGSAVGHATSSLGLDVIETVSTATFNGSGAVEVWLWDVSMAASRDDPVHVAVFC